MIDFTGVKAITIPEGNVKKITNENGVVLWELSIVEDTTPPIVDIVYSATSWTNQNVVVTLKPNEEIKDISGWTKQTDGSYTKTYTSNTTATLTIEDIAGNSTTVNISITIIDKAKPSINVKKSSVKNDAGAYTKLDLQLVDTASAISYFTLDGTKYPRSGKYVDLNDGSVFKWTTGEHTMVAYDKAGNSTTKTFIVDKG